jgi:hypothetical protein
MTNFNEAISDFNFTDLRKANPINKKGVYVIRVKKKGISSSRTIIDLKVVADKIDWDQVTKYVFSRLKRLEKINSCDLIYIGSAGTNGDSKNTLKGRYKELANRHTIQFPLWVLLFLDWKLEYGWLETETPKIKEDELKDIYKKCHNNQLPALVHR